MGTTDQVNDQAMGKLLQISKLLKILRLSDLKRLPFEFQQVWIEYLVKVCEMYAPLKFLSLKAFSEELEHGCKAMTALLQNQLAFAHLVYLKMDECPAWWDSYREEGLQNFDMLCELIIACE